MSIIKVMDIKLSNKIAAGEVVEKVMNVVKELVENSIDAKATNIKIELIDSGVKKIIVSDNGIGMDKDDALACLERHATSKIYEDDDLFNINTLGFRGEALPSIAAVSKLSLKTCNSEVGTNVIINGGVIKEVKQSDSKQGTTITVEELFYNTPARLKYLKSLYTELANIIEYVNKMALSFPNIKFLLTNNDKVLLSTDGSNNILKVINSIYGLEVTKKMVYIKEENNDYEIDGYLSYPELARSSRNNITLLVNGRVIRNNEINKTILESYHTYIPKDKYPIVVLRINCDPTLIDVNVHPTKMDVKFSKLESLKDMINISIAKALEKLTLIPSAVKEDVKPIDLYSEVFNYEYIEHTNKEPLPLQKDIKYEKESFDFSVCEPLKEDAVKEERIKPIIPLALVHGTYIVGENELGMYLIDQHAANERVSYEYYLKELGKDKVEVIELLVPIRIELSNKEYLLLQNNFDILDKIHIKYEEFGDNTLIIRSHPIWLKKGYEEEQIRKIIEIIITKEEFSKEKYNEGIAINLACKTSIKANEYVSMDELGKLLEKLRNTANPFTCPHGRPTIISYSKYDLEKLFKRAM